MKRLGIFLGFLMMTTAAFGAPVVSQGGVVNAGSYALAGLPNSAIAQGSIFIVFGSGLGPATLARASAFPLPRTLGGTSINVNSGGTTVQPIILYTSAGQVAAVMPSNTAVGSATL